jgi:hypothetical protein
MFDFGDVVVMRSQHKPEKGALLQIARVWVKRKRRVAVDAELSDGDPRFRRGKPSSHGQESICFASTMLVLSWRHLPQRSSAIR